MKPLVALVIIMGALIVVGLVVVLVTIAHRLSGGAATSGTLPSFGTLDLPIPAGCQIEETTASDTRLILRVGNGDRCNRVLIVDMATGRLLGTLRTAPEAQ